MIRTLTTTVAVVALIAVTLIDTLSQIMRKRLL